MSTTVTISGNTSELISYFQPPLHLSDQYECGLLYFSVINSTSNVISNRNLSIIRIECDLVNGSYCNGLQTHFIHEFVSDTAPDHSYVEIPRSIIYFPINKNIIPCISVRIIDQLGHCISFGEKQNIELRLHLRKTK
ncbi:unnamed protein product [Diatraea saccharalis]|uniref:Uncharacterized protein n=1 Tax=Diatraea saccharalis TaxID=40085 RepID=A0A9N9QSL9_9NEOP|nr:unnamed protein product [Diatraea saccharalis]